MPPDHSQAPERRFPTRIGPDRNAAERRLALLTNWSTGALATGIAMAVLLPFAIAWRDSYLTAVAASIIIGAILTVSVYIARRRSLATMALSPELVGLADLGPERQRLQSLRTRHALAAGLRRTADPNQPPTRFDPCPVLVDRAQAVRTELLELADTLEQTHTPNPASVALLRELLTNGASSLYNPNIPAGDLGATLARARTGITTLRVDPEQGPDARP